MKAQSLSTGTRLGRYEVSGPLGAGWRESAMSEHVKLSRILLLLGAPMLGMSVVMRQYREFTVPATILFLALGLYGLVTKKW